MSDFIIVACSPVVPLTGQLPTAPFPQVSQADFQGDLTELGPIPSRVGLLFINQNSYRVIISSLNGANQLSFM